MNRNNLCYCWRPRQHQFTRFGVPRLLLAPMEKASFCGPVAGTTVDPEWRSLNKIAHYVGNNAQGWLFQKVYMARGKK